LKRASVAAFVLPVVITMLTKLQKQKNASFSDPDAKVLAACRKGDMDAFEILVKKYQKQMFQTAFRITNNKEDARDAVQDAFVSAFKSIKKFEGSSIFKTWITTIVMNMSKNQVSKRMSKLNRNTVSFDDYKETDDGEIKLNFAVDNVSAHQKMERKQICEQVQWCISRIDLAFRDVLVLRDIQGFAYAEIASILKIPVGTVKSKLSRARDGLKSCLANAFGELSRVMP